MWNTVVRGMETDVVDVVGMLVLVVGVVLVVGMVDDVVGVVCELVVNKDDWPDGVVAEVTGTAAVLAESDNLMARLQSPRE